MPLGPVWAAGHPARIKQSDCRLGPPLAAELCFEVLSRGELSTVISILVATAGHRLTWVLAWRWPLLEAALSCSTRVPRGSLAAPLHMLCAYCQACTISGISNTCSKRPQSEHSASLRQSRPKDRQRAGGCRKPALHMRLHSRWVSVRHQQLNPLAAGLPLLCPSRSIGPAKQEGLTGHWYCAGNLLGIKGVR